MSPPGARRRARGYPTSSWDGNATSSSTSSACAARWTSCFGDVWGESWFPGRPQSGFSPRVDVYYCGGDRRRAAPKAIVKAELAGVDPDSINLEIAGRQLVISGERPVQETEGRVYQQVEIEAGRSGASWS